MLQLKNVTKIYQSKSKVKVTALDNFSVSFPQRGLFFVVGKSGCGKTTLLNIMGGLDAPTSGELYFKNQKIDLLDTKVADSYRQQAIGFVFQDYNLLDDQTVTANVNIAAQLVGKTESDVADVIDKVGLSIKAKQYASELSGGQKQRVALARALVKDADIILADEPTGNLDSSTAEEIFQLLKRISKDRLVIVITHDNDSAQEYSDGIIRIVDGKITENTVHGSGDDVVAQCKEDFVTQTHTISTKTLFSLGVKNFASKKGRSALVTIMLFLSVTVLLWAQMLMSTNAEKVMGKALPKYNAQQVLLYQGNNLDKYAITSDNWNASRPNMPQTTMQYLEQTVFGVALVELDYSMFVAQIDSKDDIEKLGFQLYDGALELNSSDYIYVSDYLFDEQYRLIEGTTDYSKYIGQEVTINDKKAVLAGVYKTGYADYVEWDYQHGVFVRKGTLTELQDHQFTFITYIKDIIFCQPQYYTQHKINAYRFNFVVQKSERKDGTINYYGQTPLTFSSNGTTLSVADEVAVFDNIDDGYVDQEGNYVQQYIEPTQNQIYLSHSLYKRLFEPSYDGESQPIYLGKTIDISLSDSDGKTSLATINGKVLAGVYGTDTETYSFTIASDSNMDFKQYGINKPYFIANIGNMTSRQLSDWLSTLKNKYEVATINMISSFVNYAVSTQFASATYIMAGVAIVIFVVACLLVVNLVINLITAKTREIGIMRSVGMPVKNIIFVYLIKIVFLCAIAFVLSIVGALAGIPLLARGFTIDGSLMIAWVSYDWLSCIIGLVMTIFVPVCLALLCLRKIGKMKPIDAIKNT